MQNLPKQVQNLLWDTPLEKLDQEMHAKYVIERVLEYGDLPEIKWLFSMYDKVAVIDVLKTSRRISAKSGNFFANLLNVSKDEIECMRKPYTQKQERF